MSSKENKKFFKNRLKDLYEDSVKNIEDLNIVHPIFEEIKRCKDSYEIYEKIAEGGSKSIYKAKHIKSGRPIAMAYLHEETPKELYDPFLTEAKITALLDHPNIIKVYDVGIDDEGRPFFTMDLKSGYTLNKELSDKKIDFNESMMIFLKICDAIAYAHDKNIIHLDLKPDNIQIGSFGEVLVCDWGLGRLLGDESNFINESLLNPDVLNNMTLGGEIKGTPGFMAPEQINRKEKTKSTDIYALGVILKVLLTEQMPDAKLVKSISEEEYDEAWQSPSSIKPSLLQAYDGIVEKAMAFKAEDRYAEVIQLKHDVERVVQNYRPSTQNVNLFQEVFLFYKRHRLPCQITLLALATLFIFSFIFVSRLKESNKIAIAEKNKAEKLAIESQNYASKLEEEQKHAKELSKELASNLLSVGDQKFRRQFYKSPVNTVEGGLYYADQVEETYPGLNVYQKQKGKLYFIKMDYKNAYKYFKMSEDVEQDLLNASKVLLKIHPDPEKKPNFSFWLKLAISLDQSRSIIDDIISYAKVKHGKLDHMDRYIRVLLQKINPEAKIFFDYNPEKQELLLKGLDVNHLAFPKQVERMCILRHIPIVKLELQNFTELNTLELKGLDLVEKLDLKRSPLPALGKLPPLKSLVKVNIARETKAEGKELWNESLVKKIKITRPPRQKEN